MIFLGDYLKIVFEIEKLNLQQVKNILLKDEIVSRASIVFKESKSLGFDKDVFYCYISGLDQACEKARDLLKNIAKQVDEKIQEQIIQKIKQEEDSAITSFGNIFG